MCYLKSVNGEYVIDTHTSDTYFDSGRGRLNPHNVVENDYGTYPLQVLNVRFWARMT